jgi:hypothetical protein
MARRWTGLAGTFLSSLSDPLTGGSRSVSGGPATLYGTCYSNLGRYYLGLTDRMSPDAERFVVSCQDEESGLMIGPELRSSDTRPGSALDREHLILHVTCATLGACRQFGIRPKYAVRAAHRFCDPEYLAAWLSRRDFTQAWLEGNNLLFVGELLVYLRDVEGHEAAQAALDLWFEWLEQKVDPETSLWGTDGYCSPADAVYGGYHQLLAYFHENHPIVNPEGLVDTVLLLQHASGGFRPKGNAGACEDVDCVDILVNLYKRFDYRRAEIRRALGRCVDHILATQNADGGFPYNVGQPQNHMGIPGTFASPNASTAFATWFRIHSLALCAEIIPDHPALEGVVFRFNRSFSVGWHSSPPAWKLDVGIDQKVQEQLLAIRALGQAGRRIGGKTLRRLGLR